jgi:hypothetical protein
MLVLLIGFDSSSVIVALLLIRNVRNTFFVVNVHYQ